MIAPMGHGSATQIDLGPLLERLRMQLANNQFNAQQAQQNQQFGQEMDLAGLKLNSQESQFSRGLDEQRAGRTQQGELARAGQAFNERELAQQGSLARAGMGIQMRGQDIGVEQAGLDRTQQGSQFERSAGQRDVEIDQGGQRIRQQGEQFDKELALKGGELDFRQNVAYRQLANEDKRLEIDQRMADVDTAVKNGQIDLQRAEGEKLRIGVEAAGMALAEAKADAGLSPAQWNTVMEFFDRGEAPPGDILATLQKSPKAAAALDFFYRALDTAQGRKQNLMQVEADVEGAEARTGLARSQTEGQDIENAALRDKLGLNATTADGKLNPKDVDEIQGQIDELGRLDKAGKVSGVGQVRLQALGELKTLAGKTDAASVARRKKVSALSELTAGMEGKGLSDMRPEAWLALFGPLGAVAAAGELVISGINRMTEDEQSEMIRKQAEELGYNWNAFGEFAGEADKD